MLHAELCPGLRRLIAAGDGAPPPPAVGRAEVRPAHGALPASPGVLAPLPTAVGRAEELVARPLVAPRESAPPPPAVGDAEPRGALGALRAAIPFALTVAAVLLTIGALAHRSRIAALDAADLRLGCGIAVRK